MPDRVSDALIFVGAGYAIGGIASMGWAAAVVSVFIAYVRAIGASVGTGQVFVGPMAKPHRMALMTVCCFALAVFAFTGTGRVWNQWVLNGCLAFVVVLGMLTSMRRLNIIANSMRQSQAGQ
jgi:phosphatidylglycerophosphate synthase